MLKPVHILLSLFWGFTFSAFSQDYQIGARPAALANAIVSVPDTWGAFHNQATLAGHKHISAGIFYESKFLLNEFSLKAGTVTLPVKSLVAGFSFYQFGQNSFKEYKIGFTLAKQLSERLNIALQFDYFAARLPENSKTFGYITFETGASYRITRHVTLGLHAVNPVENGFDLPAGKQKSPAVFRLGGHYRFDDYVLICAETEKSTDNDFTVKTGLEFMPLKNFAVRLGARSKPYAISGGMGYMYKNISTDIAFVYHKHLGFTPSISVHFSTK